jgi:hypothetical protein
MSKRGENVISWILEEKVHEPNLTAGYEITSFLIDEGFAELFGSPIVNMVMQGKSPASRTIIMKDKGIQLIEWGSYQKYIEYIISEKGKIEALQKEASRTAHRQYKINI